MRPKSGKQPNLAEKVRPHAAACGQSQKNGPPHAAACGEITSKFGRTFQHWGGKKLPKQHTFRPGVPDKSGTPGRKVSTSSNYSS